MKISASIVTYRSRDHIDACISALRRQERLAEILIVDSGSDDGTAEYLRERYPDLGVDSVTQNIGYAAGHNRNFARARGDAFLALNPDVELDRNCLTRLYSALAEQSNIASVGPKLLSAEAPSLVDSAGIEFDRTRARFRDRGRGAPASHFRQREEIFGVCGAAALYR
ncbi:MAG: glycosyltransferase, partial [Myxococcales bacterium]|nr:glycosyltransferase [Myxococcales bacterium]